MDVRLHDVGVSLSSGDILISVDNTAYVFHGSHVIIWSEYLIKLIKRVFRVKHRLVVLNALPRNSEPILSDIIHIFSQRGTAEQAKWHITEFRVILERLDLIVRTSHHRVDVSANWFGLGKFNRIKSSTFETVRKFF